MTWLSVSEFKSLTDISINDDIIESALLSAEKSIINKVFITRIDEFHTSTTKHELIYPVADISGDKLLTSSDVTIWQDDGNKNEEEVSGTEVASLENGFQYSFLNLNNSYPEDGKRLYVKYKICKEPVPDMIEHLQDLERYLAIDWLFSNVPFKYLQAGISSWSLNGVSVTFDQDAMAKAKEENKKMEKILFDRVRPVRADGIAMGRKVFDQRDRARHGTMTVGSGNRFGNYRWNV